MITISLDAAAAHVGESVRFIAAVQQVATGKRVLVGRQRVQACHVLHVGDASRQFFKVTCWGEAPPTLIHSLSTGDPGPMQLSSADAVLRIGDIALFSFCCIKSYRGNVEAQFVLRNDESAMSSTVQLLYRKDRYFCTQDAPLKDLYPMIEWYKQHCREFIGDEGATPNRRTNRSPIKDLRENMVASVLCKLRPPKDNPAGTSEGGAAVASELDGVLLCELIMYDSARDVMTVNLWDQHADKRFIARLLEHRGAIEIDGIVVSLQALSNRLLANTTPHTVFRFVEVDDPESIELEKKLSGSGTPLQAGISLTKISGPVAFATLEELQGCMFEGQATLENVRVEQICMNRHYGHESRVLPRFAPQLAERYCSGCDQALPELSTRNDAVQSRYGVCANKCKTRRGSTVAAPCGWRYRRFSMVLRDSRNERLQVEVESQATVEMVGNIEAYVLMESYDKGNASASCQFDAASAVASLLNALVEDASQKFEAQILCSIVTTRDSASQPGDSYQDSSRDEDRTARRLFRLRSLASSDSFTI
ncbi:hypothetical protein F442_11294 [Phytophthora nicotianae P10297]|uniref:Uncharacterized protein n=3 Tax=Phytophthora nicotianae TaxID=4792 RepID=V9F0F1_PHYNI|nr:hypothetical protein F443_11409 [Phytophthora nicotianae P1569]ETM43741.1 hypothetical protein L914_10932 [Phytophthora nicotianae]ETP41691.1 hypothetical protein F442_11294 [Phytophthora nicotianae P10297]